MAAHDYYKTLGVGKSASQEEIRLAYRKLARKYHPDVNKEEAARQTFLEINEAYEVLKDSEKRKEYDIYGSVGQHERPADSGAWQNGFSRSYSFTGGGFSEDNGGFEDIFSRIFRNASDDREEYWTNVSSPHGVDEAELTVTLSELFYEGSRTVTLQTLVPDPQGGYQPKTRTLNVRLPRGITHGSKIRLSGQGAVNQVTGAQNDLLLTVLIDTDSRFAVDGHDLHTNVAVSPWEAALGARVPVQTVDGTVYLTIPAGSRGGRRFRLRGKGLPNKNGGAGDIITEIEIIMPQDLSAEERRLLKELAEVSSFDPRSVKAQWSEPKEHLKN